MPVCTCGQKVDRGHYNLQCSMCKQFFHLICCNLTLTEREFFVKENCFKCLSCAEKERRFMRSPPLQPGTPADHCDPQNTPSSPALDAALSSGTPNSSNITIELLFNEFVQFKKSNESAMESLMVQLNALRLENKSLIAKMEGLTAQLNSAHSGSRVALLESSPKRKKIKAMRNANKHASGGTSGSPVHRKKYGQ